MATLRPPGLGPVVGHTTATTSRIWVRASAETDEGDHPGSSTRTIAVIGITHEDGKKLDPMPTFYFRLRREFDRSGSIDLGADTINLEGDLVDFRPRPDTEYEVRTGCLVLDDPIHDDSGLPSDELVRRLPRSTVWREDLLALDPRLSRARFRTFPVDKEPPGKLSFLLGSCRYPGLLWKVRHSDRIFGPMADLAEAVGERPRFVLMVGDQIYADKFNRRLPLGRADSYREFRERYLTAFGSPNIRRLMQRLPTYMILDDHEIEDNWSQDRLRRSARYQLFTIAIDAYLSYQWSHGPRTWRTRLYYRFDCGGYPFFVLDTRTQRFYEGRPEDLDDNHLLGRPSHPTAPPGQLQRLLDWLEDQQKSRGNVPKFIVTAGVFVPNPMSARTFHAERNPKALAESDTWAGFPGTRAAILRKIVEAGIQNVVFLSGDIHCCNVAEMFITGTPEAEEIRALSVTSSAFYWPFPFADGEPSDFVHDSRAPCQEDTFRFKDTQGRQLEMDYRARNFSQEDNFTQITVDSKSHTLRARVYDKRGRIVEEEDGTGQFAPLDARLKLKPW